MIYLYTLNEFLNLDKTIEHKFVEKTHYGDKYYINLLIEGIRVGFAEVLFGKKNITNDMKGKEIYIEFIYIYPNYRGMSYSDLIMEEIYNIAVEKQYDFISLRCSYNTEETKDKLINFYKKHGYDFIEGQPKDAMFKFIK